jgi:light-regulated signal transduction histidine kinase (bacteriophytochrome)
LRIFWVAIGLWAAAATVLLGASQYRVRALRRRQAELEAECRKQSRRQKEMESEFNSVSYSISHDLRAPLRSVHGFSQIVLKNYGSRLDEDGRHFLDIIRLNASRMNQMIEDVLMYSRLARREMSVSDVDMNELARRTAEEITSAVPGRRIELSLQPLPPARGDANMINQVWFQLIHNAVKFTRTRPEARIEIGGRAEHDGKVYFVRDNGVGFDMRYAGKLFGLFQRLVSQEEFEGNGAGLAVAKRILTRHGGSAWVEAKPDAGSAFYFSLPE